MTNINCTLFKNFTVREVGIAQEGLRRLDLAINDPQFQQSIRESKFNGTKDTGEIVLARILSGADTLDEKKDYKIDLECVMYYSWWSKVVGYVTSGKRQINTNRKFFGNPNNFASNVIHEYTHLCGYGHQSARDYGSVPYKINSLFELWCDKNNFK